MELIRTKCFGYLKKNEFDWLNEHLLNNGCQTADKQDGIPCTVVGEGREKIIKPLSFIQSYLDMKKRENIIWREVCAEIKDEKERLELFEQRFTQIS